MIFVARKWSRGLRAFQYIFVSDSMLDEVDGKLRRGGKEADVGPAFARKGPNDFAQIPFE